MEKKSEAPLLYATVTYLPVIEVHDVTFTAINGKP